MSHQSLLDDDNFWKILTYLEGLETSKSIIDVAKALEVSEQKLIRVLYFLHGLNVEFKIQSEGDEEFIVPPTDKSLIQFNFTLSEWLAFQSHFPAIDLYKKGSSHDTLIKKLSEIEKKYEKHDLFLAEQFIPPTLEEAAMTMDDESFEENVDMELKKIELAIVRKNLTHILLRTGNKMLIYPHRIVNLEGHLSVIGEDEQDSCITYIRLADIDVVDINSIDDYEAKYSGVEINNFIAGIRNVNESEIRLVLKIYNNHFNLLPEYEHLVNPYMTINSHGDRIWAATVEPSEAIFKWIESMGTDVEILEPDSFKKKYLQFCENELKKAS